MGKGKLVLVQEASRMGGAGKKALGDKVLWDLKTEMFMEALNIATRRTLSRCEEAGIIVTLQLSPVMVPFAERVTFLVPAKTKKDKPKILFSTIARAGALGKPRTVGDGYFGMVQRTARLLVGAF